MVPMVANGDEMNFAIHKFLRDWNPAEANWSNYESGTSWTNEGGDFGQAIETYIFMASSLMGTYIDFDITSVIQELVSNPSEDFGFILKSNTSAGLSFVSSNGDALKRPKLTIEYDGGTSIKQFSNDRAYRSLRQTSQDGNMRVFDLRGKSLSVHNTRVGSSDGVYLVRYSNGTVKRIAGNNIMQGFGKN
jgi:hypothetical protein